MTRGQLRIYLGAAPGVGKTYAMLDEGWRRAERGTDVVVGYVETHNRPKTMAQLRNLEVVPRKHIEYRGQSFEEMDVDAVLARHPRVALVDELAHTNVPGSRNEKRWQDIEEMLDAGIDVISTVNIQHLESLNDVVERITDIKQRETVPDAFVRAADQVELVDMTPEALRRRMAHGNIYAPEKVDAALGNYFRVGNLGALRELALLWMADKVDEALLAYRERHDIGRPWETRERVLVALTGVPGADKLVRRAARMAMRTHGELVGVHILSSDGLAGSAGPELDAHRALLRELGGRYLQVEGTDVARALVQVARAENATQIVLGATRRSRWSELTRGSVINKVVRAAGASIDVHVISAEEGAATPRLELHPARWLGLQRLSLRRSLIASLLTAVGLPLLTIVLTPFRDAIGLQNALLCYLLIVVTVATVGGLWPALAASVVAFLLLNWFFVPPVHTFTIDRGRDLVALVAFVVIGCLVSVLVDVATRRQNEARRAKAEATALAKMAGILLQEPDPLPELTDELEAAFSLEGVSILRKLDDGEWQVEAASGMSPPLGPATATLAIPLSNDVVLALNGSKMQAEHREQLVGFATQLAVAVRNRQLQSEAAQTAALTKTNELRTALLAAVSHDLRTPLASIRASATSLLAEEVDWEPQTRRELLRTIDDEASRLNTLVGNLLDMSRLQTGAFTMTPKPIGLEEIVAAALVGLHADPDRVRVDVPETLPEIVVDAALLERALANLIDNALSFSSTECPVRVTGEVVGDHVHLRVIDHGPGIAAGDRARVFQPFQRLGDKPNGEGVGLGLAVAHGFVEAIGGEITVEDTPGGGCTMVVSLPLANGT